MNTQTDYVAGFVTVSATEGNARTHAIYPRDNETVESMREKVLDAMALEKERARVNVVVTGHVRTYGHDWKDFPLTESDL